MTSTPIFNGPLTQYDASVETLPDGGKSERVVAVQADDTPVAMTAANSRFTVSTSVILISSKLPGSGESYAILEAQANDIYYWLDGKDPTVTPGHILYAGYSIRLSGSSMTNCKICRATASDAVAVLTAFKKPAT